MKYLFLLKQLVFISIIMIFMASGHQAQAAATKHVLFIGNSHTYTHDLPKMFAKLAQLGGHKVKTDMVAPGGWTLAGHASSKKTLNKISEQKWDFVVLQEQSAIPSLERDRKNTMYPAVRSLDRKIRSCGAKTILFMTWGYQDGSSEMGYNDFNAMQAQLKIGYIDIADKIKAIVAPVGIAWQNALKKNPQLDLWEGDGVHPGIKGSYLAACVFYAVIFQESPEGLKYEDDWLEEDTVQFLEAVAAQTVLKKSKQWNVP